MCENGQRRILTYPHYHTTYAVTVVSTANTCHGFVFGVEDGGFVLRPESSAIDSWCHIVSFAFVRPYDAAAMAFAIAGVAARLVGDVFGMVKGEWVCDLWLAGS